MNRQPRPATDLPGARVDQLLAEVDAGVRSVRNAAKEIGWTVDAVQLVLWGEVRL